MNGKEGSEAPESDGYCCASPAVLIFAFLMLPLLVLFPISFSSGSYLRFPPPGFSLKWYERYLDDPVWIDATLQSLQVGRRPRCCRW